jgi:hypothetical protein
VSKKFNLYLGKAGHLYAMSEFLMRGWNVAIPEVDVGDDIFVVQDVNGLLKRVQVKTATARKRGNSFSCVFNLSAKNLRNLGDTLVHYVFIVRHNAEWTKPLLIRQDLLLKHVQDDNVGTEHNGNITLYFAYANYNVMCSGKDFTNYIGDFADFPLIEH